jgi:cardiolipin synthase
MAKAKTPKATAKPSPRPAAERQARTVTVEGNRLTLLPEGPDRLSELLALIDGAKQSLRLLYYIYEPDRSGNLVRAALLRAIERGVDVALLVDGFGASEAPDDYFVDLTRAGARFCRFLPRWGRRYLLRNHQKMALADAESARAARVIIGGFNIADDYFGTAKDGAWRDIGLVVEGPAAARLAPYYDRLFDWATIEHGSLRLLRRLIFDFSETKGQLQWQLGGPTAKLSPWGVSTCRDLVHSRDVEMIVAYFAPTDGMLRRIARAGRRGRARLITAAKSDNTATIAAARYTYDRLLWRGVEVYEYVPTKLHSKLVIVDDIVHIGSSNLDLRSLYLNMELMLRVEDGAFAQMMRTYFEGELSQCVQIEPKVQERRATLWNRIRWALSFFLVTTLDYGVTRRLNFGLEGE